MLILQSVAGLLILPSLAWAISEDRKKAKPRIAVVGVVAQLAVALMLEG